MYQASEVPPVVFTDGDHSPGMFYLRLQESWFCVEVNVFRVCRERIGNAREVIREHRNAGRGGGKVRVQMRDPLAKQKICQVTGLE